MSSLNWNYRQQLTQNADQIIRLNQSILCVEQPSYQNTTKSSNTPFLYKSCVDNAKPIGYENSNMKESFLVKREKQCTIIAPEFHI